MNIALREHDHVQEAAFALGAFLGVFVFAVGMFTLILAMSVGLPRGAEYLAAGTQTAIMVVGFLALGGGLVARLYRDRLFGERADRAKTWGGLGALVGVALVLFAVSAETTVSAPFLTGANQKVLLFVIAYGLIAVGLVILRAAARIVGW